MIHVFAQIGGLEWLGESQIPCCVPARLLFGAAFSLFLANAADAGGGQSVVWGDGLRGLSGLDALCDLPVADLKFLVGVVPGLGHVIWASTWRQ